VGSAKLEHGLPPYRGKRGGGRLLPIWVISFGRKKAGRDRGDWQKVAAEGFEHFFISFWALLPVFLFSNKLTFISRRKFV
jgi:hypothetical protein